MAEQKRLEYMDIAKGIGIIAIIIGHASTNFERFVFPFHVPLFFLISGYFLKTRKPLAEYAKGKIKQLLIPYCFTAALVVLERTILSAMRGYWLHELLSSTASAFYGSGSLVNKTPFSIQPIGAIWFFLALLWAILLVRICRERNNHIYVLVALVAISLVSCRYIWLPWSIQAGIVASLYVYVGDKAREKVSFDNVWIAIIGVLVYCIEVFTGTRLSLAQNYFGAYGLSAIGAVLISYTIIYLSRLLVRFKTIKSTLCFLGRNTLPLLCFHLIEITVYPWGHFNIAIDIILLITFPVLCICLLRHTKAYRLIFEMHR